MIYNEGFNYKTTNTNNGGCGLDKKQTLDQKNTTKQQQQQQTKKHVAMLSKRLSALQCCKHELVFQARVSKLQ